MHIPKWNWTNWIVSLFLSQNIFGKSNYRHASVLSQNMQNGFQADQ